jgi:hypothetical protein
MRLASTLRTALFAATAVTLLALAACGDDVGSSSLAEKAIAQQNAGKLTAAGAITAYSDALKQNDVRHLLELATPKIAFEQMKTQFAEMKNQPVSDNDRRQFTESFGRLTSDGAVDSIMKEIEPKLASYKLQLPGYIAMGAGAMQMQVASSSITAEEKESATKAITAMQTWATKTDFADPKRARNAVTAFVTAAKAIHLKTPEDVKALSFEQALDKVGVCLGGVKNALKAYDFDMDAMLGSLKVTDLAKPGEVQVKVTLFGTELSSKGNMTLRDGRWAQ